LVFKAFTSKEAAEDYVAIAKKEFTKSHQSRRASQGYALSILADYCDGDAPSLLDIRLFKNEAIALRALDRLNQKTTLESEVA
jgi:hypothetical protein